MENVINNSKVKKRSSFISLLLSIITPGLGHLYNGKFIWAVAIPIIYVIISDIIYYSSLIKSFIFLIVLVLITIFTYVFSIIHSIILSKRNSNYQLKYFNRIYIYLIWPIVFFGIGELLPDNNSFRTFSIPTDGMENTMMVDDMILADMDYYNTHRVRKNELVIFNEPKYPHQLLIKRAIAFQGDKILIVNGKIYLNDKEYKEDNPNIIYETGYYADLNETIIPNDHIFFLGDNRPNSLDSRFWGTVPEKMVKGKPLYIYFSHSFNRIGTNLK
jgi:signal peptidase I